MWILTAKGALVNLDRASSVHYDDESDSTWVSWDWYVGSGNRIPTIANAIIRGTRFLEVRNNE